MQTFSKYEAEVRSVEVKCLRVHEAMLKMLVIVSILLCE